MNEQEKQQQEGRAESADEMARDAAEEALDQDETTPERDKDSWISRIWDSVS